MSEAQGKIEAVKRVVPKKKAPPRNRPKTIKAAVQEAPRDPREIQKERLELERIKENKKVRGKFVFNEVPGGELVFPFRKYKKDGVKHYRFVDGEIYTVPLCVAKHLNENGCYPVHQRTVDRDGKSRVDIGKKVHRFSFSPLLEDFGGDARI